ncbi:GNAT family N-acetyltransferase [Nocardia huaxiensis]|uniref:GNAT family N-acetyltransferase n=1 Tax=Nocardia huaxiensis TaxID=2755382 RepID=A0A7D6ZPI2_9NOCA|nr:GNAT family N-acetyltransferase [Nocardia huaxiensis]QLY30485.1 GNAT family N-acetyltransferase [Nocardia huaxiensis]
MTTSDLMTDWEGRVVDGIRLRRAREDDWDALRDCYDRAFGGVRAADFEAWKRQFLLSDVVVAEDVSEPDAPFVVGTVAVVRMSVSVPGGGQLKVAACAQGMVATTHQKRGLYAKLQAETMYIAVESGAEVFAAMPGPGASYSYVGVAGHTRRLRIDRRRAKLGAAVAESLPAGRTGRAAQTAGSNGLPTAREMRPGAARELLREIYDRWQRATPGALSRGEHYWPATYDDSSCVIVHPDGYVLYDLVGDTVLVRDFCAVTLAAHRELLRCLLGHGEYAEILMETALDDPTPLLLEDPRGAATTAVDPGVWMWILAAAKAFQVRSYRADFHGVIEIVDPYGLTPGLFTLDVTVGQGSWEPAPDTARADLRIGPMELASAYFGAYTPQELHRAGRLEEITPGVVRALDAALAPAQRPFNITPF